MPEIIKIYNLENIPIDDLYNHCLKALKEIGGVDTKEDNNLKEASVMVPSAWGWGGMKIGFKLRQDSNLLNLDLNGYIAQLGTTPLTKKMDEFLINLATTLKNNHNYNFEFEKLTKFLPGYKLKINKKDVIVFAVIIFMGLIALFIEPNFLIIILILSIGYFLGRKFLYANKSKSLLF